MQKTAGYSSLPRAVCFVVLSMAGLGGVMLLAVVGWDIRHDHLLLTIPGVFDLTRREWRSLAREVVGYGLAALVIAGLCAFYLRSRLSLAMSKSFPSLLATLAVGWVSVLYAFGRLFPLDHHLAQLGWIALAATSLAAFTFRFWVFVGERRPPAHRATAPVPHPAGDRSSKRWTALATVMIAAYITTFAILAVLRHNAFGTDLHDLGLYDQMLWNTLRGRPFHCTLWQLTGDADYAGGYDLARFGYNFLAEHFMPILLLLAPVYALWQDPRMLCLIQTIALGLAGAGLYRLTARMLASRALACLFLFAFLMNPLVQQTNLKDFHADAFEPLFLFAAMAALVERRWALYWPALVLLLACKEDVSLTVAALGFFLVWRERRWRLGLATLALGALWYGAAVHGVMAYLRHGEPLRQLDRYSHLLPGYEKSLGAVFQTLLLNPLYAVYVTLDSTRWVSLLRLFLPVAAMPFWAPSALIFVLPPLASNLLSNWDIQHSLQLHYSIAILGPLYVAAICGARNWLYPERAHEPFFGPSGEEGATQATSALSHRCPRAAALAVFILVAVALLGYRYGRFPGGDAFDADDFQATEHHRLATRTGLSSTRAIITGHLSRAPLSKSAFAACWPKGSGEWFVPTRTAFSCSKRVPTRHATPIPSLVSVLAPIGDEDPGNASRTPSGCTPRAET